MIDEKVDARIPDEVREAIDLYRDERGMPAREALERAIERAIAQSEASVWRQAATLCGVHGSPDLGVAFSVKMMAAEETARRAQAEALKEPK